VKKYIAVVDFGMVNLLSSSKALDSVGGNAVVTESRRLIEDASAVVLPGVGAFSDAMKNLKKLRLVDTLRAAAASGKPFLGICIGLQLLYSKSEENGSWEGLDIIPGRVVRFPEEKGLKVPQIGWNNVYKTKPCPLFNGVKDGSFFYFVHSYYGIPDKRGDIAATTEYGVKFASAIGRDNVSAVQFHPEKSQKAGLTILSNFVKMVKQ